MDGIPAPPSYQRHHQLLKLALNIQTAFNGHTNQVDSRGGRLLAISTFSRHCDSMYTFGCKTRASILKQERRKKKSIRRKDWNATRTRDDIGRSQANSTDI